MTAKEIHEASIQRSREAWELRKEGRKLWEVGLMLKPPVGTERARQLVSKYERLLRYKAKLVALGTSIREAEKNDA